MFEKAVRLKLRFEYRGLLSVEDLWDLSVQELDAIFKKLNAQSKTHQEESLLAEQSKEDDELSLKIEIVKYVVKVKLAEQEAYKNAVANKEQKQKLLAILEQKQDEALYNLSPDELQQLIANLG